MMKKFSLLILISITASMHAFLFGQDFLTNPDSVKFHTEDIINFWRAYDKTFPKIDAQTFQKEYINIGSKGLKVFLKFRIEDGKHLAKTVKSNLTYYQAIRESSLLIDSKRERFYETFRELKRIYPEAVFPDVYFVIGAKNSGGTTFNGGLIIGAEMFGAQTNEFNPAVDIDYLDEVVAHELIHFQQRYAKSNSLLAQCIREGSADFICELIAGDHSNKKVFEYGDAHTSELWTEFLKMKDGTEWSNWLYHTKDKAKPKDLGYWMGYNITKAYYNKMENKGQAIHDILNIADFGEFLSKSGYSGK